MLPPISVRQMGTLLNSLERLCRWSMERIVAYLRFRLSASAEFHGKCSDQAILEDFAGTYVISAFQDGTMRRLFYIISSLIRT